MKISILDLIEVYPTYSGMTMVLVAITIIIINLKYRNKSFKDFSVSSWKSYVSSWAVIVILLIIGMSLIIKE